MPSCHKQIDLENLDKNLFDVNLIISSNILDSTYLSTETNKKKRGPHGSLGRNVQNNKKKGTSIHHQQRER